MYGEIVDTTLAIKVVADQIERVVIYNITEILVASLNVTETVGDLS